MPQSEHTAARCKCGVENRNIVKYDETANVEKKKTEKHNCTQNSNKKVSHEREKA